MKPPQEFFDLVAIYEDESDDPSLPIEDAVARTIRGLSRPESRRVALDFLDKMLADGSTDIALAKVWLSTSPRVAYAPPAHRPLLLMMKDALSRRLEA